jgi:DNA-binding LytR/AlgR family response regulator
VAITIGVCDDNPKQVELLAQYLDSHSMAGEFDVIRSTDPAAFLQSLLDKKPQLVFLDIDMGQTSGIRLGEKIKALYEDTVLVYVTAYENYAVEAFGVRAFHYLLKPLTREKFSEVLEQCLRQVENARDEAEKTLTVKIKKEVVCLNFRDIVIFRKKTSHKVKIHTTDRDYFYYDNFSNLLRTLGDGAFIRCHQGYIANISMIRGFCDKTLFLSDNIALPVSRSYIDSVKKILAERLFAGKENG